MMSDRAFWFEAATFEAARLFIAGWENVDLPFRAGPGGLPDELLLALDRTHLTMIGLQAMAMFRPDQAEVKNSKPSSSGTSGETSSTGSEKKPRRKTRRAASTPKGSNGATAGTSPSST